ncbi:MAG: apolipoprotein N-acyltransferase [Chthoniobacterales bacterium]|nr:apolipoprotein N-acyltransferase [Chthoniobacterales bacterium]
MRAGGSDAPDAMTEAKRAAGWLLKVWPWFAAILSGALATLCFAPFDQSWACWIALTPLLAAIWFSGEGGKRRGARDLLLGYVAGLVFFWSAFFWLHTVTVPGLVMVGFYMAVYFALWGWLAGLVRPRAFVSVWKSGRMPDFRPNDQPLEAPSPWLSSLRNLGLAFILACAWTALEWVRGWMFSGWGWNGLGVALHGILPIIQIAEFTGVAGLTFAVVFVNVIAVVTVRRFIAEAKVAKRRPHYDFTLTMAAIVGLCAYGIRVLQERPVTKPLRIAAVQANVPREEKFSQQFQGKTFFQFARLTRLALATKPPPDLIIWPESSMPGPVLEDESNHRFVMNVAGSMKSDLLLGSIDEDEQGAYNAALLIPGGVGKPQVYRKLHLVPFGEYVPGRHAVPFIAQVVGNQVPGDFARGKEAVVFRLTNGMLVAPLICFEDTLGELTREFVLRGAGLLANVTNDGWFLRSAGAEQHVNNAIFRCVESRRPMARAANTGVTCFVNQFGRVAQVLRDARGSTFTEGVLTGTVEVPTSQRLTFYTRHGELFAKLCGCVALIFLVVRIPQLVRRKSGNT